LLSSSIKPGGIVGSVSPSLALQIGQAFGMRLADPAAILTARAIHRLASSRSILAGDFAWPSTLFARELACRAGAHRRYLPSILNN
jgi:hypothetical protein